MYCTSLTVTVIIITYPLKVVFKNSEKFKKICETSADGKLKDTSVKDGKLQVLPWWILFLMPT